MLAPTLIVSSSCVSEASAALSALSVVSVVSVVSAVAASSAVLSCEPQPVKRAAPSAKVASNTVKFFFFIMFSPLSSFSYNDVGVSDFLFTNLHPICFHYFFRHIHPVCFHYFPDTSIRSVSGYQFRIRLSVLLAINMPSSWKTCTISTSTSTVAHMMPAL